MKLLESTWQDVRDFSTDATVLIPTGSLEQHGPHLPLFTDTFLVTAVAEAVERRLPESVILTPTIWLGASGHHLAFPGSLSASFEGYGAAIEAVVESLLPHGFRKFYVLNGHGGNEEPNGVALRALKAKHPTAQFGHSGYFAFCAEAIAKTLTGPLKTMAHACEAETSLMMHLHPSLVREDKRRVDGLILQPNVPGIILHFDERTEEGSIGYADQATAEKGRAIFEAAVEGSTAALTAFTGPFVLIGRESSE